MPRKRVDGRHVPRRKLGASAGCGGGSAKSLEPGASSVCHVPETGQRPQLPQPELDLQMGLKRSLIFNFGVTPNGAQGFPLAPHSGMAPGGAHGSLCSASDLAEISCLQIKRLKPCTILDSAD